MARCLGQRQIQKSGTECITENLWKKIRISRGNLQQSRCLSYVLGSSICGALMRTNEWWGLLALLLLSSALLVGATFGLMTMNWMTWCSMWSQLFEGNTTSFSTERQWNGWWVALMPSKISGYSQMSCSEGCVPVFEDDWNHCRELQCSLEPEAWEALSLLLEPKTLNGLGQSVLSAGTTPLNSWVT